MVVLGGVTRLTRSGLSMTEWKFTGEAPPSSAEAWASEFAKYRASPEYRKVNIGMTLEEFKFIYWMEYAHRMWGRALGVYFVVPLAAFAAKGWVTAPLGRRLGLLCLAGGSQGLVGWWMVKSGLEEPEDPHGVPRVSPYRLATHLTCAFAIYSALLWTTLDVLFPRPSAGAGGSGALPAAVLAAARRARAAAHPLAALVGVTAVSGAFVAGMDAGRAYNTFPLMGGQLVPAEYWSGVQPAWRNAFENTAAVQFHHRVLAVSTLLSTAATWAACRSPALPPRAAGSLHALVGLACVQVTLGVTALLHAVPTALGSAHQAGALALFSAVLSLMHAVRRPAALAPLARDAAVAATAAARSHQATAAAKRVALA